jgi:hypothetical protein
LERTVFIIVNVEQAEPGIVGVSVGEAYPSKERAMAACRDLHKKQTPGFTPLSLVIVELKHGAQPRGARGVPSDAVEESYNCDGSPR